MSQLQNNFRTAYDVAGTGPCVVLVHGLGLARWMWRGQLADLAKEFSTVSYDLIGHGGTPPLPTKVTLDDFATQLLQLIDDLQVACCALVGFSLGGMIVRQFVNRRPDRVGAVAILNSAHCRTAAERDAVQKRAAQARHHGPGATAPTATKRWFTESYRQEQADRVQEVEAAVAANDPRAFADAYEVLASGDQMLTGVLERVEVPLLALTASDDHGNSTQMAAAMAAEAPQGTHHTVAGLRHMGLYEKPELFNPPLLKFLRHATPGRVPVHDPHPQ